MLIDIHISGYRGFSRSQVLHFAVPNDAPGSGLTIITGSNNSGKSSIIESIRARAGHETISFTSGTRNPTQDEVIITYNFSGHTEIIRSISKGSSETDRDQRKDEFEVFVLPSRRTFEPYFGRHTRPRTEYINFSPLPPQRSSSLPEFSARLFNINRDPTEFNKLLKRVLGFDPRWTIDRNDQGSYFLKFYQGAHTHSSDGMGEGIISIFAIVDALHDSKPGSMIVIDEPELSLHPSLQKRVAALVADYAATRQVVISTHSPYFVDIPALAVGARIARVTNSPDEGTSIFELSQDYSAKIKSISDDQFNPHVFGLNAREMFFQEDGLILVEGQEDVVLLPEVARQLAVELPGSLFGWGVGGASKMTVIAGIMHDLGFKRVAGILDGDKADEAEALKKEFPEYFFATIPAKDIRTKPARDPVEAVDGLLDQKRRFRAEYEGDTRELLARMTDYLEGHTPNDAGQQSAEPNGLGGKEAVAAVPSAGGAMQRPLHRT